jgi:hypothetical protein
MSFPPIGPPMESRVEFPIRKTIYETIGIISHVRVSPRADAIAFMEHPNASDDRGIVLIIDLNSKKRTLSQDWEGRVGGDHRSRR